MNLQAMLRQAAFENEEGHARASVFGVCTKSLSPGFLVALIKLVETPNMSEGIVHPVEVLIGQAVTVVPQT
jgi:hypothetical protein